MNAKDAIYVLGGLAVVAFLARAALIGLAAAIGAKVASPASIPLMLAVTIGAQMLVVRKRVRASGVCFAPTTRRGLRSRQ